MIIRAGQGIRNRAKIAIFWFVTVFLACFFGLLLLPVASYKEGFQTVDAVIQYAARLEEYPGIDNEDFFDPDYSSFWKKSASGFIRRKIGNALYLLGLRKAPIWSPSFFKTQLEVLIDVLDYSRASKVKEHGELVQKVVPQEGDVLVLFGPLHGAFHSLVRNLGELHRMGMIDEKFALTSPHYYFVFMGDAISRSAYGAQTLSVIAKLMQVNPDHVVYLLGEQEAADTWRDYSFKRELDAKTGYLVRRDGFPWVSSFFEMLPRAFYLSPLSFDSRSFVRISTFGQQIIGAKQDKWRKLFKEPLDESVLGDFLHDVKEDGLLSFDLADRATRSSKISGKVFVTGDIKDSLLKTCRGLCLLDSESGKQTWGLFSSPTLSHQELFHFSYDAFSLLKVGRTVRDWTITLYFQDAKECDGYQKREYQFFSEEKREWFNRKVEQHIVNEQPSQEKESFEQKEQEKKQLEGNDRGDELDDLIGEDEYRELEAALAQYEAEQNLQFSSAEEAETHKIEQLAEQEDDILLNTQEDIALIRDIVDNITEEDIQQIAQGLAALLYDDEKVG